MKNLSRWHIPLGIIMVILLLSCSTSNKHKTVTSVKTDSVTIKKADSVVTKKKAATQVKKQNQVKKVHANVTNEKETITVYDTVFLAGKQVIKYVIVKEKGIDKTKTVEVNNKVDSVANASSDQVVLNKIDSTTLHKDLNIKDKDVTTTTYWWLWLLLLIPAYLVYRYWPRIIKYFV